MTIKAFVFDAYGTLYDVHSVAEAAEQAFPKHGEMITQIWRLKQLEYSWLSNSMNRFEDFGVLTRRSLHYALSILGLQADDATVNHVVGAYDRLTLDPDAVGVLTALRGCKRAILSNGSQAMLDALVGHSGLQNTFDAVISIDPAQAFKPDPRTYALVSPRLGVAPEDIMFVTSNGFDTAGARAFGFNVARVVRVTPDALRSELTSTNPLGVSALYRALRSQNEALGFEPTVEVSSLCDLPALIA